MSIGRIFSSIVALLLIIGLFIVAFWIFVVVVAVLVGLGIVQWLRSKGIIADKKGSFKGYDNDAQGDATSGEQTVIEGEYEKIDKE